MSTCSSFWDNIDLAPPNAIFHTKAMFTADPDPRKMNLGIGAYRTDEGVPYPLTVVRKAEQALVSDMKLNKEYLPITGDAEFCDAAQKLMFGVTDPRIATVQSLSGTGGLRLGAEFIANFRPGTTVYVSNPTWGNHKAVFGKAGVPVANYRYWNADTRTLDFDGMIEDIRQAPAGSVILLHSCAHNPTGVDPTQEQWRAIQQAIKACGHLPFFDSAYQGFATGDLESDSYSVRYFLEQGMEMIASQSFAKNMGLYNQRVGTFSVVAQDAAKAKAAKSQIALIIRPMYSNPPAHGAWIVKTILNDPELYAEWVKELSGMSHRIIAMRSALYNELQRLGTPGTWEHITSQIGMFTFTGLTRAQCQVMISKHHVYLLTNGRISMAGVTSKNAAYLASAIDDVVRNV